MCGGRVAWRARRDTGRASIRRGRRTLSARHRDPARTHTTHRGPRSDDRTFAGTQPDTATSPRRTRLRARGLYAPAAVPDPVGLEIVSRVRAWHNAHKLPVARPAAQSPERRGGRRRLAGRLCSTIRPAAPSAASDAAIAAAPRSVTSVSSPSFPQASIRRRLAEGLAERQQRALVLEQEPLHRQAAAEAGERAVGADHAVAREDERQRVLPVRGADARAFSGPNRAGAPARRS